MASFLLEVGTEELPAAFVDSALQQWEARVPASLSDRALTYSKLERFGTPRRLALLVKGLPDRQPDRQAEVKGPAVQAAFKNGQPTKAAEGFARSRNVAVSDLEIRSTDKGEFVFVQQTIVGKPTAEILTELVPEWILGLEGKRFMRWAEGDLRFSRPIRWLVALLEAEVLSISLVNGSTTICSDRVSQGHRVLHPQPVNLKTAEDYAASLRTAFVEVDPQVRHQDIQQQVTAAATQLGGTANIPAALLKEVTQLVEWPTAVVGKFEPEFLQLPPEVAMTVMISHQRYFPVLETEQKLLPAFIAIANGDPAKSDLIAQGNERVIRARLTDGQFFHQADRSLPLADYSDRLEKVTFQEALGSVAAKVKRIMVNAGLIADQLGLAQPQKQLVLRAAQLCKADLVTQMVGEFPELQGIMGRDYALASGEPAEVATAIAEHYWPKGAGDRLPQTLSGQIVGLADRLDTLISIFSLGMLPTGSSDPFALRRAANAVVNITWSAKLPLNLGQLLEQMMAAFTTDFPQTPAALPGQLQDFFLQRLRSLLQEEQAIDYDLVNAVLGENDPEYAERALADLLDVGDRARYLQQLRQDGILEQIYETVNRATRLARQGDLATSVLDPAEAIKPDLLQQKSEQAFYQALLKLLPQTQAALKQRDYDQLVKALGAIAPTVSEFFDGADSVLVMVDDLELRQNRLNLLALLRNHARVLADFGAIVKV
ncbi:MAG: glycine--tRNA ligase subunit beta [Aphanocapsa sp. GSE-SYN-MK-11-07L]|jgi:glycyl-tRNA synthetase beta chain|nr:glycine--tRNA ligase subunit beta [Aphanocapsa sp. GSE-SYN-MK-11-07L]